MIVDISKILEYIDFEKIHNHMVQTNWTWGLNDPHIPSVTELISKVTLLIDRLINNSDSIDYISQGGFSVGKSKGGHIHVFFSISESNDYDE